MRRMNPMKVAQMEIKCNSMKVQPNDQEGFENTSLAKILVSMPAWALGIICICSNRSVRDKVDVVMNSVLMKIGRGLSTVI